MTAMHSMWEPQLVQNTTAGMLTMVGLRDRITPVLTYLQWLPVCFREQFKVLLLTFKPLYSLEPTYLKDCLLLKKKPTQLLWSSSKTLLQVPLPSGKRWAATQERTFLIMAPKLQNSIPKVTHPSHSVTIFS